MQELFVTCPHFFEELLVKELHALGIQRVFPGYCGVCIPKTLENVWTANYCSRIATRVLWPIASFPCRGKEDLYAQCKKLRWSDYLNCKKTFAIDSNVQHPTLKNSLFAAFVVKDAICDWFRETVQERPSINTVSPDVQLNLFIQKGHANLYVDTSGAPLHKRGWRRMNTEATLHESLAAALLLHTGYQPHHTLCDPCCGSGTFLVEAAMIATHTPPGFFRKQWGFFHLPGFRLEDWLRWKQQKDQQIVPLPKGKIMGSDKSREAIDICLQNLQRLSFGKNIDVRYDEIAYYKPKESPDFLITNPPYGKRIEASEKLYLELSQFLDTYCKASVQAHILSNAESSIPSLLQRPSFQQFSFKNGGLPVTLYSFLPKNALEV